MNKPMHTHSDLESDEEIRFPIEVADCEPTARSDAGLAIAVLTIEAMVAELEDLAFGLLEVMDSATDQGIGFELPRQDIAVARTATQPSLAASDQAASIESALPCTIELFANGVAAPGKRKDGSMRARAARRSDTAGDRIVHQFALPLAGEGSGMQLSGSRADEHSSTLHESGNQVWDAVRMAGRR